MEAIRALQKQLKAAQKGSSVRKISERNCIDLVQKLLQLDQVKLFHTSSGKEWLTPDQLDREIRDALHSAGGRLSITDLPNEVGVAIEHCEPRVELMRKKDSGLTRLGNELLSSQYLQGVAQEIEESLEEAGCLAVSDLATRFNLPADFIRESVIVHLGSKDHVVKQNTIYTSAHAERVEARVRGVLRACTQPVTLATLAQRHGLDGDMLAAGAQKVLKAGVIQGKLQGSTFTPKAYSDAQAGKVAGFFDANGYMPLSTAKAGGHNTIKEWAKAAGADGVALSAVFLASQLIQSALGSITEAVSSDGWIDVQPLLPPSLTSGDACELLQHLVNKKELPSGALVIGQVVASKQFVKSVASCFEEQVAAAAEKALTAPAKTTAKKAAAADDDDDGGGGKKKGRRAVKGKKGRADDEDDEGDGGAASTGAGDSGIENQAIYELLGDKFPELPAEVHSELCDRVQPLLATMAAEAQKKLRDSLQSKVKVLFEQTEKFVQERYETLALGVRALDAKKLQDSPLHQHLMREVAMEPLHRLLALRLEEATGASTEVTAANRKQCLDKLIAKEGSAKVESLSKLLAGLSKGKEAKADAKDKEPKEAKETKSSKGSKKKGDKGDREPEDDRDAADVADLSDLYHAAAGDCHIFCRKVDKKREKAAVTEQQKQHRDRLKDLAPSDAVQVLSVGLHLCLLQEGVPGCLFPAEPWALRLVSRQLAEEEAREEALGLCDSVEKEGGDAVALEAAVSSWKERCLGGK